MTDPISGKPLDTLGTVELIERLAKSVRLRATGTAAPSAIAATMPAPAKAPDEATAAEPQQPQGFESPQPAGAGDNPFEKAATVEPADQPAPFAPPVQEFGKPHTFAAPSVDGFAQSSTKEDNFVPSALKPLDLDADDQLDEIADSFSLPIRKPDAQPFNAPTPFSAPASQSQSQSQNEAQSDAARGEPFPAPKANEASPQQPEHRQAFPPIPQSFSGHEEPAEETTAQFDAEEEDEQPFGSLLELRNRLTRPQQFVRVDDEPVDDTLAEPAVVFPGQGGQPAPQPVQAAPAFAPPPQSAEVPEQPAPNFAEPNQGNGEPQQPFAPHGFARRPFAEDAAQMASAPAPSQPQAPVAKDPAETERALRSALATLQRMSGAA